MWFQLNLLNPRKWTPLYLWNYIPLSLSHSAGQTWISFPYFFALMRTCISTAAFFPRAHVFPASISLSPGRRAHGQYLWLWFQKPFLLLFLSRLILPLTPCPAEAVVVHPLRPFHWHVPNFHCYLLVCWWQQMELTAYGTLLERRTRAVWFLSPFCKCSINSPVVMWSLSINEAQIGQLSVWFSFDWLQWKITLCVILCSLLQVSIFKVMIWAKYSLLACFFWIFSSSWGQQSSEAV